MSILIQNSFSKFSTTLLLTVFEYVYDHEPVYLPLPPLHPRHVLALVCKTWFIIIRSTFSLWNNIHFKRPDSHMVHQRHPLLKQLAFCVKLSGLNPLAITFDLVCGAWGFSIVHSVITPYAHQIKKLSGMISGNDIFSFLTMGGGRFDILESVEICFVNTQNTPISSFPIKDWLQFTGLKAAPRLHKATFHLANGLHPQDLHLPWDQLTSLDLGTIPMTPEVFIKILHFTSLHLEDGFFSIRFSNLLFPHLILSRRFVTMHTLRTLRLMLFFPSQDTRLFSLLRFPVLQSLQIQMHDYFQNWDISLYTKLVRTSRKTIRQLSLEDYPPHDGSKNTSFVVRRRHHETMHNTLDKLFKVIPNTEKLRLPLGVYIHASTANKIASYALLPKLSILEVSSLDGWPILAIVRRRHVLSLQAALQIETEEVEFEIGCSRRPIPDQPQLHPPTTVRIFIPRSLAAEEKRVLVQEAQALGALGTNCFVQSTRTLPLPTIDPRDVMRSRLLAWVDGVPQEPPVI